MEQSYFLGANTAAGFASLYGGFCRGEGDYLRIVKGGPGTGKSGFMRQLGAEAARRGLDVEFIRCSGDPDSLDGIYVPALGLGYVDGTAPHVMEPRVFGAEGDYIDLGQFCRTPLAEGHAARAVELSAAYKAKYERAYALLAAGKQIECALLPPAPEPQTLERAAAALRALVGRIPPPGGGKASLLRRYAGAVSCKGLLPFASEELLCSLVYVCEDGCGLAAGALAAARDEALARAHRVVEYLSPFDGQSTEAVLLPDVPALFLRVEGKAGQVKRVALDRLCGTLDEVKARRRQLRAARRERARCVEAACGVLAEAKALHDELEAVYRPYMDFPALDAFTAKEIARLFA